MSKIGPFSGYSPPPLIFGLKNIMNIHCIREFPREYGNRVGETSERAKKRETYGKGIERYKNHK